MRHEDRGCGKTVRPPGAFFAALAAVSILAMLFPVRIGASDNPSAGPRILSEVEIGADRFARRFFRPIVAVFVPAGSSVWHLDIRFDQKTNSRLQGEVDFRVKTGWSSPIGGGLFLEGDLVHFCRHITSRDNRVYFDVNELLGRIRYASKGASAGLGLGTFLGKNESYRSLAHIDAAFPRILGSEFSLAGEAKFVNFRTLLHEIELSAALTDNVDLFIRNARFYEDRNMTYAGFRLKSGYRGDVLFEHQHLRLGALPGDGFYKIMAVPDVGIVLFARPDRRALLQIESRIPILKGNSFLGRFRPESLIYPLAVVYERKAGPGLYGFGYGRLEVEMPLDTSEEGSTRLGFGLGLRNQEHVSRLIRPRRFEIRAGWKAHHDFEAAFHLGLNTVGRPVNFGAEMTGEYDAVRRATRLGIFCEIDGSVKVRPFAGIERLWYQADSGETRSRLAVGIQLIRWASLSRSEI